jgi:hypothetical protein
LRADARSVLLLHGDGSITGAQTGNKRLCTRRREGIPVRAVRITLLMLLMQLLPFLLLLLLLLLLLWRRRYWNCGRSGFHVVHQRANVLRDLHHRVTAVAYISRCI